MKRYLYDSHGLIRKLKFVEDLKVFCQQVFSSRFDRLSQKRLKLHFSRSYKVATNFGIKSESGIFFYQQIAFMFGTDFGNDPLYPWAKTALRANVPEFKRLTLLNSALMKIIVSAKQQALE